MPTQNHTYRLAALYPLHPKPYTLKNFTFSAKERDVETGLSYYGSRYYSSDLGIWLSVDPQAAKYPSLSPYVYCANNPIKLVDPNGEEIDWVERKVNGRKEVFYDRTVKSQADVDKKYGNNSGIRHLADGSKVGNGQYTVYNDHINNKNGVAKDANGNALNPNRTIIYGNDYTLFAGVTDESVDAGTLHNNLMGTSYTGPNNPMNYDGKNYNYDYNPKNLSEQFSKIHDIQYDQLGAKGMKGALFQTNTWQADLQLAISNEISIRNNPNLIDRVRSKMTAVSFGIIGLVKGSVCGFKRSNE